MTESGLVPPEGGDWIHVTDHCRGVDAALIEGWPLKRVEAVMRAVLRAGTYELKARPDVPARAVITEYVDVAAAFLARDEVGMINAVLDNLARRLRAKEFAVP